MQALLFIPWFRAEAWHIRLGSLDVPIQPFGLLVATGVLLGYRLAEWRCKKIGLHPGVFSECVGYVLVTAFVMSHVLDAIFYHWSDVVRDPLYLVQIWKGLSSFGGFIGAVVGLLVWSHKSKVPALFAGDPIAFGLPLGWMFGRTGCFVVHDHPGRQTDFFLGVQNYQVGNPPFVTRHDLGLYEIFFCMAVIPLFLWLGRKTRPHGFFLGLLPILYAPIRFGLDFLRALPSDIGAQNADPRYLGLTPGHWAALGFLVLGSSVLRIAYKNPRPAAPAFAAWPPAEGTRADSPLGKEVKKNRTREKREK